MKSNKKKVVLLMAITSLALTASSGSAEEVPPKSTADAASGSWKCGEVPIKSRWAANVTPENVWPEYPRPQLVREAWVSLNGLWDYTITQKDAKTPESFDGRILVPFPLESALSGVQKPLQPTQRLWYRRDFDVPGEWRQGRVLLHFGAVDWQADVWVNGKHVGDHQGGYAPFTIDVTDALRADRKQELVVAVVDPTDSGAQPRGKQVLNPHGIWYTPTSGIWQTVWIEPVPAAYISGLHIVPDFDAGSVAVTVEAERGTPDDLVIIQVRSEGRILAGKRGRPGEELVLTLDEPRAWSPADPFLYDLVVTVESSGGQDRVESYFGLRKISVAPDKNGTPRIHLNNEPLFQYGMLDQGFWPAGLYCPPSDEAMRYDVDVARQLGFNMLRKHVKVEPDRWYAWCDRVGMLVWQDMPNGDRHIPPTGDDIDRSEESAQTYRREWKAIIDALRNHPSVVVWVPFNEGWGQFDTASVSEWTETYDPSRLVDAVSGWVDRNVGDMHDVHVYPGPGMPPIEQRRAAVLGEFGGLGLPVSGHTWQDEGNWGYRSYESPEAMTQAYLQMVRQLRFQIDRGLSAAVYTQVTDVEIEVNGFLTYDRAILKPNAEVLAKAHRGLHAPPRRHEDIVKTAESEPQEWRYATTKPGANWMKPDFDDSDWKTGKSGFGTKETPGAVVNTEWNSEDIWIRRSFELQAADLGADGDHTGLQGVDSGPRNADSGLEGDGSRHEAADKGEWVLRVHHDDEAEVFLNGQPVASLDGYTSSYADVSVEGGLERFLKPGRNVLAVHCHQKGGGQYIDIGLTRWMNVKMVKKTVAAKPVSESAAPSAQVYP